VVVVVGETVWDPFRATSTPFKYTWSASVVVHVSVEDCPAWIVVGLAVRFAVSWSMPPPELLPETVTVALDETRWSPSTATSVYVLVAVGETTFDPLLSTWTPSR
jgi:hypothetical protein